MRENAGKICVISKVQHGNPMHVPYHRSDINDRDIEAVTEALRSGWLTSGPKCIAFEGRFAAFKGVSNAISVNSCTAALHLLLKSLDLKPGDEVITTPMTFVATVHSILHAGGTPVFADIQSDTMNLDPFQVEQRIGPKTKAILTVHVGGNPCEMDALVALANRHSLALIEDCAHALEGSYHGKNLGTFGMGAAYSFYPTKNITAAEGGMITTDSSELALRVRVLARHGLSKSTFERTEKEGTPLYDVLEPGFKMNMTDVQAALGLSQLERISDMHARRKQVKARYDEGLRYQDALHPIRVLEGSDPALHLYQLMIEQSALGVSRDTFVAMAREEGVELSVNYLPVHQFSWYRQNLPGYIGKLPHAEKAGATNISLPFYPTLTDPEIDHVVGVLNDLVARNKR